MKVHGNVLYLNGLWAGDTCEACFCTSIFLASEWEAGNFSLGMIYLLTPIVIQSEAKNLENIYADVLVYVIEILPPLGRLNDK